MLLMATQIRRKKIFVGGHWLPMYMHVPIWELQDILKKSLKKCESLIISLALLQNKGWYIVKLFFNGFSSLPCDIKQRSPWQRSQQSGRKLGIHDDMCRTV